ncbi:polar amino acid transport system substrate-binding protein [Anoxybacillus calidus]|jgi:polar amino acid transport system substrate-binding protein|uniref:Polar amino acid transport system substrate-binding protein n=1 Tax=[Anoxybacillus] calidus TaxID=575178 RepID=A0A7W0BUB6_9BACL|nr:ABC transporter substrate-binding protein [Anoxybacillus calidus]MBA2871101.1 polar amino acid transport system substrate-binding protein [Anoxybacillus calidus]
MKKYTFLCLTVFLFIMLLAGCGGEKTVTSSSSEGNSSSNTLDEIKKRGVLVVGSSNDAPFAFIDKDTKQFSGIDAEIITEIAKRLGIPKVEMKEVKFENLLLELNNKNIDIVTDGMYVKPEREKIAKFTNIWYKEGEAIVVLKDSPIKGIEDLKDKVVGGQKGTAFLEFAQKLQKEGKIKEVKVFGSQAELLLAVNTNKIDACITDSAVAGYSITKDPSLNLKLVSPYKAQAAGNIAAAVRKEDKELLDVINKELDKLKEEGFVLKVLKKYGLNEDNAVPVEK